MNLLQVAPYSAHPPSSGGQWRIHGLMQGRGEEDTVRRVVTESVGSLSVMRERGGQTVEIDDDYSERRVRSLALTATNAFSRVAFGTDGVHASNVFEPVAMRVSAEREYVSSMRWADVIVVEHPWQFEYVTKRTGETPVVYSSHNVEVDLYAEMADRRVTRPVYRRLRRLEEQAVREADLVVTTTERDRATYRERFDPEMAFHVAHNAAPPREEASSGGVTLPGVDRRATVACFLGSDHGPNVDAVENLSAMAREMIGEPVEFVVVGTVCNRVDRDTLPESVHLAGFVEDLDGLLEACDVALNPVTTGSGANVKVPEYMSYGLPVVSTPFGARGVPATDGEEILLRELREFPEAIRDLRAGRVDATTLSERARRLVETQLNWPAVSERLFERLRELVKRSPERRNN